MLKKQINQKNITLMEYFYHYDINYYQYHQHVHLKRETNKYEEEIRRGKRSQKDIGGALTNLCKLMTDSSLQEKSLS